MSDKPKGELVIQTIAMPQDTNPNGDIFGGWVTSQMDLGSGILAAKTAQARVVTAAMEGMSFLEPVRVGDTVRCYAHVEKIGRTSMTIPVEVWVTRYMTGEERASRMACLRWSRSMSRENRFRSSAAARDCYCILNLDDALRLPVRAVPIVRTNVLLSGSGGA